MDEAALLSEIKKKEERMKPLFDRMDADLKLYYLEKFVLMDKEHKKELPKSDSITLNDPKTYADRVVSILGNATRRFRVEGNITAQKEGEAFLKETFSVNDEILALQQIENLEFHLNWYGSIRGWVAVRALMLKVGNIMFPEIVPLDPRWCSWKSGRHGLVWGSYRVMMSPERVNTEFGKKLPVSGKDVEVRVAFTKEDYLVWIKTENVVNDAHDLGYCPIFIAPAPTHPSLLATDNEDAIKYQGESIYAANRDIYEKLNDIVSVWATLNKMSFMTPVAFTSPEGRELPSAPYGIGVVVNLKDKEEFIEIPTKEISQAAQALFAQLDARIQRGGLPHIDFGELHFELSAVAISKLTESRNVVFIPRLDSKSTLLKQVCRSLVRQYKGICWELDTEEELTEEDPHILFSAPMQHPMNIFVDYHSVSPEQNIANFTVAQVGMALGLPKRYLLSEIVQIEDPEGAIRQANREKAEEFIPELMYYRMAHDLLEEAKESGDASLQVEAEIILNKLGMAIEGGEPTEPGAATPGMPEEVPGKQTGTPLGVSMPGTATHHVQKEELRRKGIQEMEKGQAAQKEGKK